MRQLMFAIYMTVINTSWSFQPNVPELVRQCEAYQDYLGRMGLAADTEFYGI